MTVWGVAPRIEDHRPIVVGLELAGTAAAPKAGRTFLHRCDPDEPVRGLMLLATYLETEVRKGPPTVVIVRAMDWFQVRKESVARPRLHVEGVILAVARRDVPKVEAMTGKAIGALLELTKADAETWVQQLLPGHDTGAAMAGMAALVLSERD